VFAGKTDQRGFILDQVVEGVIAVWGIRAGRRESICEWLLF
jgi:hypothetical protein